MVHVLSQINFIANSSSLFSIYRFQLMNCLHNQTTVTDEINATTFTDFRNFLFDELKITFSQFFTCERSNNEKFTRLQWIFRGLDRTKATIFKPTFLLLSTVSDWQIMMIFLSSIPSFRMSTVWSLKLKAWDRPESGSCDGTPFMIINISCNMRTRRHVVRLK